MDRVLMGLKSAAEPTRLRILSLGAHGELSVTDLTTILGQSQPRVSRHLKLLCDAGLLSRYREGTFALFRLADRGAGADLARTLVDLVPEDDAVLARDLKRLESVKTERAEQAAAYFRENAGRWDEIRKLHIADSEVERAIVDLLPDGEIGDLLDLGTGTGRMLMVLGGRARRAVGIDLSREMLAVARANLERSDLRDWQVRQGDLFQLPLSGESFDVAVMHQVLHYLEDPLDALVEAARVMRPGGQFLVVDFALHDIAALRSEHAHRWLGFAADEVVGWMTRAGFDCDAPRHLPGTPLTVTIWSGRRRAAANVNDQSPQRPIGRAS